MTRAVRLNTIMCRNGNIENLLPNLYKMRAKYIKYILYRCQDRKTINS